MNPCREVGPLLAERAAGPLSPADEARLARHLSTCAACRALARALARAIELSRVPAAGAEEERGAASLPGRVLAAARRPARAPLLRWAVPLAAAAGAAMAFVVPAALHRARPTAAPPLQVEAAAAQPAAAWEDPDEALWEWTAALSEADADDEVDAD